MTALDNYKINSSLMSPDEIAKLPMKEALDLLDYIHKTTLLLVSELNIHQQNLKALANMIKDSVSKK